MRNRFGRRVATVGIASALLVLGWVAPASAAVITSFTPTSGPAGTSVTINGTFVIPVSSVKFNGVEAFSIPSATTTQITAIVPAGATTGLISVTDAAGTATSATNFTVNALPAPNIDSISPTSGCVGSTITIDGDNLIGTTAVTFTPNRTATFTVVSPTRVTATVPAGTTTGAVTLTTAAAAGGGGTDTTGLPTFTIASNCPTITSFTPTSGPVGTTVVITGTNFTGATAVRFNGVSAQFTFNSATQITAKVPTGATTGRITVTTPVGTATSATDFVVGAALTITSFTPTFGPVGTVVTITGTGFTGATAVRFNNVSATSFTVNSATKITVTVPTGATTGKISVIGPGGTATSTGTFTVSVSHSRTVTLSLRKHLVARGQVSATDAFTACVSSVPVKIQRRSGGSWTTVKSTTTTSTGSYKARLKDRPGKYRAKAKKLALSSGTDVCLADTSPARKHTH